MNERIRPEPTIPVRAASDALAEPTPAAPSGVLVQSGIYAHELPIAGRTVGEVRQRFRQALAIDPQAAAVVDGVEVPETHVVRAEQVLTFVRRAGEKGSAPSVEISGADLVATAPEGLRAVLPLASLLPALLKHAGTGSSERAGAVLPDRVRLLEPMPGGLIAVHETAPALHSLRWIADDSPATHGARARFATVRIALPFVLTIVVLAQAGSQLDVQGHCEVYFRNAPLTSTADELLLPALLNCAAPRGSTAATGGVSVLCTQSFDRSMVPRDPDPQRQVANGVGAMLGYLFGSSFNRHIEHVDQLSWFTMTAQSCVDPRVATIAAWQRASANDPLFALEVPWLPARTTLARTVERMRAGWSQRGISVRTAGDLARIVFLEGKAERGAVAQEAGA